jgi:hypothetical protein
MIQNMYEDSNLNEISKDMMSIVVRFIGLFLLLAGLWVAIMVMLEALDLYRNPENIERLAIAIEKGSNIDKSLVSIKQSVAANPQVPASGDLTAQQEIQSSNEIRVSYFFAWAIALLLLLLIGRISLTAIKTGGELVLYDTQVKKFVRMLVKESNKIGQ